MTLCSIHSPKEEKDFGGLGCKGEVAVWGGPNSTQMVLGKAVVGVVTIKLAGSDAPGNAVSRWNMGGVGCADIECRRPGTWSGQQSSRRQMYASMTWL